MYIVKIGVCIFVFYSRQFLDVTIFFVDAFAPLTTSYPHHFLGELTRKPIGGPCTRPQGFFGSTLCAGQFTWKFLTAWWPVRQPKIVPFVVSVAN